MSRSGSGGRPAGRRRPGRPRPLALLVGATAAAILVPTVAFALSRLGGDDSGRQAADQGVSHVHGLGVNPADGDLYVATHHGVFRIGGQGEAALVGTGQQDTMGFTVAGPDRFLASGHPDLASFREGERPLLGLMESRDAGRTWQTLSLQGESDFHGLTFSHGRVFGFDSTSGSFMVSDDRRTWKTRSQQPLASFVVDPEDADHIVGAGPDGLVDSTDGGRTWAARPGPTLAVLSWDPDAGLFGADRAGGVYRAAENGTDWQPVGELDGAPQAFLAHPDGLYAAAEDPEGTTGIFRSSDSGRTWRLLYRDEAKA